MDGYDNAAVRAALGGRQPYRDGRVVLQGVARCLSARDPQTSRVPLPLAGR